jgi:hypothetical protein
MKIRKICFLALIAVVLTGSSAKSADVEVSIKANFSELNDYGRWVIVPGYGTVWHPDADPGWRPFTYGHWVYSSDGWVWDADEPFGWIVFHYGNWYNDRDHGWVWVPGYDWSPARVRWQVTDDEIGWMPLEPEPRRGHHANSVQIEWSFSPVQFFTSFEVHNHVAFRAHPRQGVLVKVRSAPPQREFVQLRVHSPITAIKVNKVRVTARERPLIRVEVQDHERRRVEVPVGPKYRKNEKERRSISSDQGSGQSNPKYKDNDDQEKNKVKVKIHSK